MSSGVMEMELDFIEELRLRRWARENYVSPEERSGKWHPIIHDEMEKKDGEAVPVEANPSYRWNIS